MIPTVIIGLGTFGGQVTSFLRTLVYEELGTPGLPIFRFMQISTHKNDETEVEIWPPNQESNEPWEKLDVLKATIPSGGRALIQSLLEPGHQNANETPGWREWFDPALLGQHNATLYENGAGSIRMIGRACLWYCWNQGPQIQRALLNAKQNAINERVPANALLHSYFARKTGQAAPPQHDFVANVNSPRVYLVGSLCGGSGAGMFLDLAYFFKSQGINDVFGIFSVPDTQAANALQQRRIGANAFAALKELDFYSQLNTTYRAQFPGSANPIETTEPPFTFVRLASPSNMLNQRLGKAGITDENTVKELAKVCATTLFFELIGGNASDLETKHINYPAQVQNWGQSSAQQPHHVHFLSSFGAGTAHYPKYRIAGAAACKLFETQLLSWIGQAAATDTYNQASQTTENQVDKRKIERIAKEWFEVAVKESDKELVYGTSDKGSGSLFNEFSAEYKKVFLPGGKPLQLNSSEMEDALTALPKNDPFSQRFGRNGTYHKELSSRLPAYTKALAKNITALFDRAIDQVMIQDKVSANSKELNTLAEIQALYHYIRGAFLAKMIKDAPSLPEQKVDTGFMDSFFQEFTRAEGSLSSKLFGLSAPTQNYYRKKAVTRYGNRLDKEFGIMLGAVKAQALNRLAGELDGPVGETINKLFNRVSNSLNLLSAQYAQMVQIDNFENLLTVVVDEASGIENDIQTLVGGFDQITWPLVYADFEKKTPGRINVRGLLLDSRTDDKKVINLVIDVLVRRLMGTMNMNRVNLVNLLTTTSYAAAFANTARRTEPLIQLTAAAQGLVYEKFICGGQTGDQAGLQTFLSNNNINAFDGIGQDTAMGHMLHLYQEVAGFRLDHMSNYGALKNFYDQNLCAQEVIKRVLHTDMQPNKFEIVMYRRAEELTRDYGPGKPSLMRLATEFLPNFFYSAPTSASKTILLFKWREGGIDYDAVYDPEKPEKFIWEIAASEEGTAHFKSKVLEAMEALSRQEMEAMTSSLRERILTKANQDRLAPEYTTFQQTFNADFVEKKGLPWWK
jgi:hypothetical protein